MVKKATPKSVTEPTAETAEPVQTQTASVSAETQTVVVPKAKKKQIELSDEDFKKLTENNWSKAAWEVVARKHHFDPDTLEQLDRRIYLATHKVWSKQEQRRGGI